MTEICRGRGWETGGIGVRGWVREKNIFPSLGGICVDFTSGGKPHMNNLNFICIHGIISHFMHFNACGSRVSNEAPRSLHHSLNS